MIPYPDFVVIMLYEERLEEAEANRRFGAVREEPRVDGEGPLPALRSLISSLLVSHRVGRAQQRLA